MPLLITISPKLPPQFLICALVDGDQFLPLAGNNAGDVFLKFVVMPGLDKVLPAFDSEYDVDVDLGVGICHERRMALLTELGNLFLSGFYKYGAPTEL